MNQELYHEMDDHLLHDSKPSGYFNSLGDSTFSEYPFTMLGSLKNTPQSPVYHPEGSVWNHTMLVVDEAASRKQESSDPRVFMWAALLHDTGKPDTTRSRKGKITSYDHDKLGEKLSAAFLEQFGEDSAFVKKVSSLVQFHMQILYVVKSLPFADISNMKKRTDIGDVALLGLCDRLGRLNPDKEKEEENISLFLQKCHA